MVLELSACRKFISIEQKCEEQNDLRNDLRAIECRPANWLYPMTMNMMKCLTYQAWLARTYRRGRIDWHFVWLAYSICTNCMWLLAWTHAYRARHGDHRIEQHDWLTDGLIFQSVSNPSPSKLECAPDDMWLMVAAVIMRWSVRTVRGNGIALVSTCCVECDIQNVNSYDTNRNRQQNLTMAAKWFAMLWN